MTYPFTAVVGQDEARLALLLCAVNPHALHNIVDKLLDAAHRHVWEANPSTVEELENTYADIEGTIEEVSDDPAIAPNTRVGAPPQNPAGGLDLSELGLI